jgi:hypothetical protein
MKKNTLITAFTTSLIFFPLLASAQTISANTNVQVNVTKASEAQIFTACSQTSIEIRDEAIGSARTAYNNSMAVALDARKEAEKKAVAIEDTSEKKDAIRVAVEDYKKAVTAAQENLTTARKEAWATFETNTKDCRDSSKDKKQANTAEKRVAAPTMSAKKTEAATLQADMKMETKASASEIKTFREVIKEQIETIKAFFKIGGSVDTETSASM